MMKVYREGLVHKYVLCEGQDPIVQNVAVLYDNL